MSTYLNFGRDVQGYNAIAPTTATDKWSATLSSKTATSITVPSNHQQWIAIISVQYGTSVWIDLTGATAAIPASGTLASNTSELITGTVYRTVYAGNQISAITSYTASDIGISLYAVSYP